MKVDIETSAIVGEIAIEAPPSDVFEALTDPQQLAAWWGEDGMYRTENWKLDLRVGGAWSGDAKGAEGSISTVHGKFLRSTRPGRLLTPGIRVGATLVRRTFATP